jgi:hypothetical protein
MKFQRMYGGLEVLMSASNTGIRAQELEETRYIDELPLTIHDDGVTIRESL